LLTSGKDVLTWKWIITKSAEENGAGPDFIPHSMKQLEAMSGYCRTARCRHRQLVEHFGQSLAGNGCGACDVCLGEVETEADSTVIAQKILSCVARVKESFGVGHVVAVLRGENTDPIRRRKHEQLSTYGLLKAHPVKQVRDWVYQLLSQGLLEQSDGEYPLLKLNASSWAVMRGQQDVHLTRQGGKQKRSRAEDVSWEGIDRGLFDELRALRKELADAAQMPAYIVFNDYTLRELARLRPTSIESMRRVSGVGGQKLSLYGERFTTAIAEFCSRQGIESDVSEAPAQAAVVPMTASKLAVEAFPHFRRGASVGEVMVALDRSASTIYDYLTAWIAAERPASVERWVNEATYHQVAAAARRVGTARLKPIYLELGEQVSYDDIRVVVAHLQVVGGRV
jgi:ATP-dependent DNA helicase RecQ